MIYLFKKFEFLRIDPSILKLSKNMKKKKEPIALGWAVIINEKIIATPVAMAEICSFAIFHTKEEAKVRVSWLAESLEKQAKIIHLKIYL